jgi:hypothetical protein
MSVTLNGHIYSAPMFLGYGYQDTNPDTGLPNFPESLGTDLLAQLASAATAFGVAPGAAGGYVRSNGAAWVRVSGLAFADFAVPATADFLFTDATFDIGKSAATRPRDGFFSRNVVIGGTLGVTGATSLAAISALGTVASDLLFPDATYDIGKSGATRPRDGFFSRNVVIGGTLGVTGAITGSLTGNASTAAALQTARKISGTSFDGSADVTVTFLFPGSTCGSAGSVPWYGSRPYYQLQPAFNIVANPVTAETPDVIKYAPFTVARDCTIDELGFELTTAAASSRARVGIYTSHATNFGPDQLIVDAGDQDTSVSVGLRMTTGLSVALKRGVLYWAASVVTGTLGGTGYRGANTQGCFVQAVGSSDGNTSAHAGDSELRQAFVYAALPATAAPTSVVSSGGTILLLARFSA